MDGSGVEQHVFESGVKMNLKSVHLSQVFLDGETYQPKRYINIVIEDDMQELQDLHKQDVVAEGIESWSFEDEMLYQLTTEQQVKKSYDLIVDQVINSIKGKDISFYKSENTRKCDNPSPEEIKVTWHEACQIATFRGKQKK